MNVKSTLGNPTHLFLWSLEIIVVRAEIKLNEFVAKLLRVRLNAHYKIFIWGWNSEWRCLVLAVGRAAVSMKAPCIGE